MPRRKLLNSEDRKVPKSLSVKQSDHLRHLEAAEEMGLSLNEFLVLSANEVADRAIKGLGSLDLAEEILKQGREIAELRKTINKLIETLQVKEGTLT